MKKEKVSDCYQAPIIGHLDSPSGDPIRCSKCGEICGVYVEQKCYVSNKELSIGGLIQAIGELCAHKDCAEVCEAIMLAKELASRYKED